jgi:hypothetical protein
VRKTPVVVLLLGLAVLACGGGGEGFDLYRQGKFEEAHASFRAECEAAGDDAGPALFFNRALAALQCGMLSDAEAALEQAADTADDELRPRLEFLRGNTAFARCELAERQAATVEAEPFAFEIAIRLGEKARDHFIRAAMSRADWPEARRNVERTQLALERLRGQKREAERKRDPRSRPEPKPLPSPGRNGPEPEPPPEGRITELSPGEVRALFERLAKKEREKRKVREAHREERMASVERDW